MVILARQQDFVVVEPNAWSRALARLAMVDIVPRVLWQERRKVEGWSQVGDMPPDVDPAAIECYMELIGQAAAAYWPELMPEKASFAVCSYEAGQQLWPHSDRPPSHGLLSVSASLQITDPADYDGGDLIVAGEVMPRDPGALIVFPGSVVHQITEVTRGRRYALIVQTATRVSQGPMPTTRQRAAPRAERALPSKGQRRPSRT